MSGLYEIVPAPGAGVFEVRLNPEHSIFHGHFPGNPVLPGICSLMIIRECASRVAGMPLEYASIGESKFLAVITPEMPLTVKTLFSPEEYSLTATIYNGETTMVKLKARLRPR